MQSATHPDCNRAAAAVAAAAAAAAVAATVAGTHNRADQGLSSLPRVLVLRLMLSRVDPTNVMRPVRTQYVNQLKRAVLRTAYIVMLCMSPAVSCWP